MPFIYCLVSEDTVWYVGRTKDPQNRYARHASRQDVGCGADLIPEDVIWWMEVLEEVTDDQVIDAERFYYEFLNPRLNKTVPGRSQVESTANWRKNNPDRLRQSGTRYQKSWRETNREHYNTYMRNYRHSKVNKKDDS